MKILVTGASGLVGSDFVEKYLQKYDLILPAFPEFDITDFENTRKIIKQSNPRVLINFAAFTDVASSEGQRDDKKGLAWKINVEGVRNLVNSVSPTVHFIQISTDMVFSGSKEDSGPYSENHKIEANSEKVTWYGYTKGEGEKVLTERRNSTILRIIYPVRASYSQKLDYLRKPLSLFDQGKLYPMFNDQKVSIAFIDEISLTLEKIIEEKKTGIFHTSSSDITTPYELTSYLIEKARGVKNAVKQSSLDEFLKTVDSKVRYPKFGGLEVKETEKEFGIKFSTTHEIVDKLIKQGIIV